METHLNERDIRELGVVLQKGAGSPRYNARWKCLYCDNGKVRSAYGPTRQDAIARRRHLIQDHLTDGGATDRDYRATTRTVAALANLWLLSLTPGTGIVPDRDREEPLEPTTVASYAALLRRHVGIPYGRTAAPWGVKFGALLVTQVKPADVRELFDAMREAGHKAGVRRALHWRLKAIFRYAVNIGWLGAGREGYVTVMDSIEPPRGSSQQRAHINREQALAFIAAAQESGSRYADAFEVLLRTGARKGELLAIRWEDVDLEAGWLTISGSLKRTRVADHYGTVLVRGDTKTASSNREVLIDADIAAALERQRVHQEAERLAAGKRWRDSGLVFTSTTGGPVEFSHFNSAFKSLADKVLPGVGFVPHGARHTVATLQATKMMQQTGRVLTPEEWASIGATLGHRDGTITKNVYGHLSEELEREARRANAKALGSAL